MMLYNSGDQSDGNSSSSHTLSTEPLRHQQQLHTAPNHAHQPTPFSSASQSTHIKEKESDVEKAMSNGGNLDASAATEKLEVKQQAQNTPAMLNEKIQDPNLIGWDGIVSSSPDLAMQVNPTEHPSQVPTTLRIPRIGPKARNTSSPSSTPS